VNFGATRIGVHAGPALVGNFGGSRFFDYTAYGDTINTAARREAANKYLGTRFWLSAAVADATENFRGRPVGDVMLRGRSEPLPAYEPLTAAVFEAPMTKQYSEAFTKTEGRRPGRDAGLCSPCRAASGRRAGRLSFATAAEWRQGRPFAAGTVNGYCLLWSMSPMLVPNGYRSGDSHVGYRVEQTSQGRDLRL
jgi:hypothetical protein